jgi:hypothetical protein
MAFCTVPRLTGSRAQSSDSAGMRSPGLNSPRRIASVNASTTWMYFGPTPDSRARAEPNLSSAMSVMRKG